VVIAGDKDHTNTKAMINEINKKFLPFSEIIFNDESKEIYKFIPFIKNNIMVKNKATAYVCKNNACLAPTNDLEEFHNLISK
jgi:uncharacterized protein YyaL (SSP411 family)